MESFHFVHIIFSFRYYAIFLTKHVCQQHRLNALYDIANFFRKNIDICVMDLPRKRDFLRQQSHLSEVSDFRKQNKNFRHKLSDILFLSICGILSGAESFEEYRIEKEGFLRSFLELPNGIPSHDTVCWIFLFTDSESFNTHFMSWVRNSFDSGIYTGSVLRHVQFDGK